MITRLLILLLICSCIESAAQTDSVFHFEKAYPGASADFTVDNLGYLYILSQNGQLKKLRPNGDSMAVFNNVRKFGKVFSFDVSNPLKLLLYYKDFGTIVILDRLLNSRSTLDLRKENLLQVKAVGQSYDNNIWVFDEIESKLKKIGDDGKIIDQSSDFRMIFDTMPSPEYIIDQDKFVYLYDPAKGVYIFDYYGGFQRRIPFRGWLDFKVINKTLFGRDDKFLYRYEPGSLQLQQYQMPSFMLTAQKIIIAPGYLYLLQEDSIRVYSFK
ncbi:MAG: hypothetical protein ABI687_04205 [Flavitalea sp.]